MTGEEYCFSLSCYRPQNNYEFIYVESSQ